MCELLSFEVGHPQIVRFLRQTHIQDNSIMPVSYSGLCPLLGVVLDQAWAPDNADSDEQGSTQTVVHLAAGEQVWIRQEAGNAVRGGYWTVFTGYLVHAG